MAWRAPVSEEKAEAGSAGMRSGVPAAASVSARTTIRLREFDLEGVVARRPGVGQRGLGRSGEGVARRARRPRAAPPPRGRARAWRRRRRARAGPAGSCRPRSRSAAAAETTAKAIGGALAQLQIAGMGAEARPLRPAGAARRSVRPARARSRARASSPGSRWNSSSGTSRRPSGPSISTTASSATSGTQKSDGWVAMQASLQPSTACSAVLAVARVAARARLAPVAGAGGVVEIGAARALHQVAADGRGIAQLRRGAGQQRLGDRRIGRGESRVVGEIGIAHHARRCARRRRAASRSGRGRAAG